MSGVGGGTDIDDDQGFGGGGGVHKNDDQKKKQKERFGFGYRCLCTENFRKAKKFVLFPFTKAKKQILHRRNKRVSLSSSAPANAANGNGRFSGNTVKGRCFCLRQPNNLDSPCDSHRSDPNDPSFSGEMLKLLIEKNDFYSKECNPHLD